MMGEVQDIMPIGEASKLGMNHKERLPRGSDL